MIALLLAAAVSSGAPAVPDTKAVASSGLRVTPVTIIMAGRPGSRGFKRITVANTGTEGATFSVALSDFWHGADGVAEFPPRNTTPRSASGWIVHPPEQIDVAAETAAFFDCVVNVPFDAAPGSYFAGFRVSIAAPAVPIQPSRSRGVRGTATTIPAIGIKLIVNVRDSQDNELEGEVRLVAANVSPPTPSTPLRVRALLSNPSAAMVRPEGKLAVVDAAGAFVGTGEFGPGFLFPGSERWYEATLALPLAPGGHRALVAFDAGGAGFVQQEVGFEVAAPAASQTTPRGAGK